MSRATTSLPTPLSPVMSAVESTLATRRARSTTLRMAALLAMTPAAISSSPTPSSLSRDLRRRSARRRAPVTRLSAISMHSRSK